MSFRTWALAGVMMFCALPPSVAQAQDDEEEPFSIKGFSPDQEQAFFLGLGYGLLMTDVTLLVEEKPRLICAPDTIFSPKAIRKIASDALAGAHDYNFVAVGVLYELRAKYPCEKVAPSRDAQPAAPSSAGK